MQSTHVGSSSSWMFPIAHLALRIFESAKCFDFQSLLIRYWTGAEEQMTRLPWQMLKALPDRPELDSLGISYEVVTEPVYKFDENQFAVAAEQIDNRTGKRGRFIDRFLWIPSLAAVRGLILAAPSADEIQRVRPPSELLLRPDLIACEDILRAARWGEFGLFHASSVGVCASILERAFRIAVGRIDYYFSSGVEDWTGETPVLIALHTTDREW